MDYYKDNFCPTFYNPFEIKQRRRTSPHQLKTLESSFLENTKPNANTRRLLAQELGMTPRGVQIWFQNRRAKAKLQKRKMNEQEPIKQENDNYYPYPDYSSYYDSCLDMIMSSYMH
ncbi:Homeodomain-like protein [Pilobolus umbonatus]|nr:Homeodomain-like protein [Pilobolus umbonatus]